MHFRWNPSVVILTTMLRLGVTGTDTGVGKTVVAAAILALLRRRGLRVAGMKPIETGVERGDPRSDAVVLARAAGARVPPEDVCPIVLPEPLAPMIAAHRAGIQIDLAALDAANARLSAGRGAIVVESAGGLLVPLAPRTAFDDLFRHWRLDVIIVAANRLGAVNHTMLTIQAARAAGLRVRCVVLNTVNPEVRSLAEELNAETLRAVVQEIPVMVFPWMDNAQDYGALADVAESSGLGTLLIGEDTADSSRVPSAAAS
jgi:dethiobiotin synthetase